MHDVSIPEAPVYEMVLENEKVIKFKVLRC